MSDLHCPATLLLTCPGEAGGGSLTRVGLEQARALGESLRHARLAVVYTSPSMQAVQTAEVVVAATGASLVVLEGLEATSVGETGGGIRTRVQAELETIADAHRGENVLVVSHRDALQATLPSLVGLAEDVVAVNHWGPCAVIEVAADADGWAVRGAAAETGMYSPVRKVDPNA